MLVTFAFKSLEYLVYCLLSFFFLRELYKGMKCSSLPALPGLLKYTHYHLHGLLP